MAAREVDMFLEKSTSLPVTGGIVKRSFDEIVHNRPAKGHAERAPPQVVVAAT